jgi:hypothetical protein
MQQAGRSYVRRTKGLFDPCMSFGFGPCFQFGQPSFDPMRRTTLPALRLNKAQRSRFRF